MNGFVISVKYFPKNNLHLFRPTTQNRGHMLTPKEEVLMLISNALRKGMALNCSHLSPLIRT